MFKRRFPAILLTVFISAVAISSAAEPQSAEKWFAEFSKSWDETAWEGGQRAYIRPLANDDWQFRMKAIQGLSRLEANATDTVLKAVTDGTAPERILAAQALGYLGTDVPARQLIELLQQESNATVRLYLVDAIGMLGKSSEATEPLKQWRKKEANGDVKKHISYALERSEKPIDSEVLQSLREFDTARIANAKVGKIAPDFRLKSVDGEVVQLSQYRGKQPVVLVFIYGDT